ncbi:nitrogenase iron-molybdenum cofactor biosynthesis protein NifN [Desulfoluna spongiiphila]|uniref:Nitrogenase iron-molybdenum cofactor biosynthesis protein NifN n=1 Tax=Desulfoluna spongiiphila TaxID=419481 RepID=A0A1G5JT01_9BACT|nr:nitrogenase iron-molybdenum cofactor biosynthesis protein NifN [Desulfoluna spongiiphila]SCY90868.1 nitrogenase molybdenum-iron protein NifN [Desulfoluna spongiiphila]
MDVTYNDSATTNACKLCTPLGASLVFKGVRGSVPLMHGSQGCATYIRRYLISHFREPVDIASSNFSEDTAIFGGGDNLKQAITNVTRQYKPELVGISTTCLSETIGDDVGLILKEFKAEQSGGCLPEIVHVSTPSYRGTHMDGFHDAVAALLHALASSRGGNNGCINILPGMVSPADMRHIREIVEDFDTGCLMLPDYSETLDGMLWATYQKIPDGGIGIDEIREMGGARATIDMSRVCSEKRSGAQVLKARCNIPAHRTGLPLGVKACDRFFSTLSALTRRDVPKKYTRQRGRLLDAFVDGHKYISGKRAVVYAEEDLVVGLAAFLCEIGIIPVVCASGGTSGHLREVLEQTLPGNLKEEIRIIEEADFQDIEEAAMEASPDLFIGNSKGYSITRKLGIPLIRVGFPIHDRFGGQRSLHVGYRGTQQLFDNIVNAVLEARQTTSDVGYSYM